VDEYERKIKAKVWLYPGPSPWYFITIPEKNSLEIKKKFGAFHRGWGSIPVRIRLGLTNWDTSIFWEKKGTYILPIKKSVRASEKITSGDTVSFTMTIQNIV